MYRFDMHTMIIICLERMRKSRMRTHVNTLPCFKAGPFLCCKLAPIDVRPRGDKTQFQRRASIVSFLLMLVDWISLVADFPTLWSQNV